MTETSPASEIFGFPPGGVFNAALDAVVVMDEEGLVRDWNPAAEQVFGYSREEAVGQELAELIIPGPLREAHRNALRRYLETGQRTILDRRLELVGLRRDGTEFPVELTITRMATGETVLFSGFVRDLGVLTRVQKENTRLHQRMAFLAQAGLALEASLDVESTLQGLADLTVPELAELAVVDLLPNGNAVELTVAASVDPAAARRIEELRRIEPLRLSSAHPVARVLRSRQPLLVPTIDRGFQAQIAQGPEHLALMTGLGYRSAIVVPLIARKRALGTLSLLRSTNREPFDADDLVLTIELARRAGLAVDNAQLFESTCHLARTLQQSLLPRAMPKIPGVQITGLYRAAAQGQEVGGDFYDVFSIGERHWGIAIGDVCGKGPEAAALTSLARYTIRALAGGDPATLLHLLNDAVLREVEFLPERFLTAVFAVAGWEDGALVLELAAAGHPPPVVRRVSGEAEPVAIAGPLVGVASGLRYTSTRVELEPGDTIVFYTDGLTDARAPAHVLGESDITELVGRGIGRTGEELAEFLVDSVTGGEDPRDDIALLVVEVLEERPRV